MQHTDLNEMKAEFHSQLMENEFNSTSLSCERSCRTCLKSVEKNTNRKSIFSQNINNTIQFLTSETITEDEGLPLFICNICYEKLNSAVEFKKQILGVDKILKKYLMNLSVSTRVAGKPEEDSPKNRAEEKNVGSIINNIEESCILPYACFNAVKESTEGITVNLEISSNKKDIPVKQLKKSLECPSCNELVKNVVSLRSHLRTHGIIEKKLECVKCKKKYTNQYDLNVHLRKHNGTRPFSCNVCERTFADRRCFEKHKKIHSGEKLFKCELCDKSFLHSYTLKTHQRVHSGEKPFVCAKCGRSFATTTQLKLHTRIHHTQEKPYACNLCSKVFASSSALSNHKITHTGERKFICSVCGKGSRTTSDLKCHLRTHTGERPFTCTFPECNKNYKTNSQLCSHIRTHMQVKKIINV